MVAEDHALIINLRIFFAQLPVTHSGQVQTLAGGILVLGPGTDDLRGIIHAHLPLGHGGSGTVPLGTVLLGDDHLDFFGLAGDGREVGVVILPQLMKQSLVLGVAAVGLAVGDGDGADAKGFSGRFGEAGDGFGFDQRGLKTVTVAAADGGVLFD